MADKELNEQGEGPDEREVREESEPRRCPHCKNQVSEDADVCPRCKRDLTQPAGKKVFSVIVLIFVAAMVIFAVWAAFSPGPSQKASGNTAATSAPN
jgi:uncharacterized paraquat-inducible protein A